MSGDTWFPRADYVRMGWSDQMIEHQRWLSEAACAATGAQPGNFSTFGDQEGLGQAFDYQPPADDAFGFTDVSGDTMAAEAASDALDAVTGIGDVGALLAAVNALRGNVEDLCEFNETKDQEIAALRRRIEDLECLYV